MMDKKVEFRYIPHTYLNIDGRPVHFVGERNHRFSEIVVDGDVHSGKFVIWYIFGEEVIGFATFGY